MEVNEEGSRRVHVLGLVDHLESHWKGQSQDACVRHRQDPWVALTERSIGTDELGWSGIALTWTLN